MQKSALLAAIQQEIKRQSWDHFIDEPPSVAQGGNGVVVSGCTACKIRINSMHQFLDHLANAMPALIDKLAVAQLDDKSAMKKNERPAAIPESRAN